MSEHAVVVHYALSGDGFGADAEREVIYALGRQLEAALADNTAGELDGNEFGAGEAIIYLYGADADHLYRAIEASVRRVALRPAYAVLRYGDADDPAAEERRIEL